MIHKLWYNIEIVARNKDALGFSFRRRLKVNQSSDTKKENVLLYRWRFMQNAIISVSDDPMDVAHKANI